jgi:hypothetical protein|tara:strand:- start:868 stop:1071 length:204 start_codon:yes stop_codon:yes gene_type:complete
MLNDEDLILCIDDLNLEIFVNYDSQAQDCCYFYENDKSKLSLYQLQRLVRNMEFELVKRKIYRNIKL